MSSSSRYIPALDGLRALAVAAVLLYHMNAAFLPSGLLGVTIFFVLSGYLITGLLIREWSETRAINLPKFWLNRVRRLFPAIVFVLAGTAVLCAALAPDMLTKLRNDLFAALFWFTNWWYVFQDLSYFEAMGAPSPVTHFWSLAIEEQFYLIWPPMLLLLFRKRVKRKNVQRGILVACVVSVLLMCALYDPQGDPSRVYYGTDTRAFSLLIGAWLAFEFPAARLVGRGRRGMSASRRKLVGWLGLAALAGILAMMVLVSGYSPFLYYGGILLLSLLTGVLILALVNPANPVARFFSLRPLVWVGKLSYSIYLWHYPLLLLMNPQNFTGTTPWYAYLGQVAVIVAAAAFSYYFVETPIRRGAIGRVVKQVRAGDTTWAEALKAHAVQVGLSAALLLAAVTCLVVVPPTATQTGGYLMEEGADPTQAQLGDASGGGEESSGEGDDEGAGATVEEMLAATPGETPEERARNTSFLMIGDSVSRALADDGGYGYFGEAFPNATLDAVISRRASAVPEVYQQHVDAGWDGPAVVFSIGTNGVTTSEQIAAMIDAVPADKKVFLVNIRTPQPLEADNNAIIAQAAAERDNVELIDWYSASANHDEYFDGDGTHLTGKSGCEAYLALLTSALTGLYEE